jgi:acyl-CoA synthetase (AMP-forming)/AMP-acid ligase II
MARDKNGSAELLENNFGTLPQLIAAYARERSDHVALEQDDDILSYSALDKLMDGIASALQHDRVPAYTAVAIVADTTVDAAAVFLGALRAGCIPTPMPPSATPEQLAVMIEDSGATIAILDAGIAAKMPPISARVVRLENLREWISTAGSKPSPVVINASHAFNIIYSSGTTGTPKGIVHTHAMRWTQIRAYAAAGFGIATTLVATPLYSNTTLVSLLPTLAYGGTAILLGKFDARRFLEVAEKHRATHAMLVPVQYQRIMAVPDFDRFDLSSFLFKSCTSAPFSAELKADVVKRWPGALIEIYGMTEGGGTCLLSAHEFPDKLHTVGTPAPGNDIRLIDERGNEVPQGEIGEIVGRSGIMMAGYHGRSEATAAASWTDKEGNVFIRHGDLGKFDKDGFLTLMGRSKDMIISGGFNIYPPDIEAVLLEHPAVAEAAVVGVPSDSWGETPYAYVVIKNDVTPSDLVIWANDRVGKTQRLSGAKVVGELPRNAIGKILKNELRDLFSATSTHEREKA